MKTQKKNFFANAVIVTKIKITLSLNSFKVQIQDHKHCYLFVKQHNERLVWSKKKTEIEIGGWYDYVLR